MYLLAVSGGPDSMFLLNHYKHKKIIVAHVNYNQRDDALYDQTIVTSFCKRNNIPHYILNVTETPRGNFQNWARIKRYQFFKKLYDRHHCTRLLMAHHKDDFLETAIIQQQSGRKPRFFGIKKHRQIDGMNIYRPYVNRYWKDFFIMQNEKQDILYAVDSSNAKLIYKRNQIRNELRAKTKREKESMFAWFKMANKILHKKFKRVDQKVNKLRKHDHDLKYYRQSGRDEREVLYAIIHQELGNVKLSTSKIEAMISFIRGQDGNKKFIINNNAYIYKQAGKLTYNLKKVNETMQNNNE